MAINLIQIKRSATTNAPSSLNPGELAYSNATGGTGVLYIGSTDGSTVVPIGGVRNPGTLTANQALVANSTSGIDKVYTGNLQVNYIEANGAGNIGTAGYILTSGGSTSNVYWSSLVGVNTAAQYTFSNTINFQNTITFGANLIINTAAITWVGNTTTSPTLSFANTGVIQTGNSTVTASPQVIVANSLGTTTINTTSVTTNTVYVNAVVANTIVQKLNTIVSSATRVVLTAASPQSMLITGSVSQSIQLPDATGLANGTYYEFNNNTTNGMQIYYNDTTTTGPYIPPGAYYKVILLSNASTNGNWDTHSYIPAGVGFGNTLLTMAGIPISGTGNVSPQTNVAMNIGTTALMYANVYSNNIVAFSLLSAGGGAFTANSLGLYHTGLVNAANFTTTGTVNTGTVFATSQVNAASYSVGTTFTANSTVVNAVAYNISTSFIANTLGLYHTGIVNAANFTTTGTVNTGTVFATSLVNAASYSVGTTFTANSTVVNAASVSIYGSGAALNLTNTTSGYIKFGGVGSSGLGAPTLTSYSAGVRAVLFDNISASVAGFSIGIESGAMWYGVSDTTHRHNWYAGITQFMSANVSGLYHTGTINAASHTVGSSFIANTQGLYHTGIVNAANFTTTGTVNTGTVFATGQVNATSFTVGSAFIANTQNVVFTGTSISATSANLSVLNMAVSGNLIVSGTVTTIDTTNLSIKDNVIVLASNQATSTTTFNDIVDAGFAISTGNTAFPFYSGLARIVASSSNTNPYFKLYGGTSTLPGSPTIDITSNTGTLQAFLLPWGVGGGFVVNSTAINITSNSTVSSAIVANSITTSNVFFVNAYSTGTINAAFITIGSNFIANTLGLYHTGTINAASYSVGSSFIANTLGLYHTGIVNAANFTTTGTVNTGTVFATSQVNATSFTIGSNFIANTIGAYHTGIVNAASHTVGTSFIANSTVVNAASFTIGSNFIANTLSLYHTGTIYSNNLFFQGDGTSGFIRTTTGVLYFGTAGTNYFAVTAAGGGSFIPTTDNLYNLGSSTNRWANIYTGDLQLSNEGSDGNEIDHTTGSWTIQEGEDNLYILNRKTGKRYMFVLKEV
jgi:hypothetical protein